MVLIVFSIFLRFRCRLYLLDDQSVSVDGDVALLDELLADPLLVEGHEGEVLWCVVLEKKDKLNKA